jgi:hypothetical protein
MRCFFRAQHLMLLPQICGSTLLESGVDFPFATDFQLSES